MGDAALVIAVVALTLVGVAGILGMLAARRTTDALLSMAAALDDLERRVERLEGGDHAE